MSINEENLDFEGVVIEVDDHEKTQSENIPGNYTQVESDLLYKMKRAYVDFFDNRYEPALPKNSKNEAIFPTVTVKIDEEEEKIIFDYDFFEQLCDVYIINGWEGILSIEKAINEQEKIDTNDLIDYWNGKPIKLNAWNFQVLFFNFTKQMLALLIRETLITIERISAERIIAKLSITNIELAKAWNKYKIKPNEKITKSWSLRGDDIPEKSTFYSLEEKTIASDLFSTLTPVVNEKYDFDLYVKRIKYLPEAIRNSKLASQQPNSFTSDPTFRNQQRINAEEMTKDLAKYSSLKDASEKLLKQLEKLLVAKHPLGLLIYTSLKKGFAQAEMESLFGLTIDNLRKDLESIADKVNPQNSKVEQLIPFHQTDDIFRDIFAFKIPLKGIEKDVIEKSVDNFADLSFFPLLAEENINQLFSNEIIEVDSFENIVGFHYLSALIDKLGEIEKKEKEKQQIFKTFSKFASGLSLAAFVTPVTAPLAPIIRGGAALADLAVLAYTINTITDNLKKSNELLKKKLVNQDDFTTESFAQIGEVISLRKEFYDNLTEQLALEIINIFVFGNLPVLKQTLLARSYYYDIETLADVIETQESPE
jgi:hypothetical protein